MMIHQRDIFISIFIASSIGMTASVGMAGEGHTLFHPTPNHQLRPMTTEHPSKTDSPYSLDAGHFQIESNLYGYIQNDDCNNGTCSKSRQHFIGGSTNLRIGLTDRADIQFIGDLYREQRIDNRTAGTHTLHQGYGDTLLRLKVNAFGNHPSNQYSLGVLPHIKLPTNQDNLGNDDVEGGIGFPFNINFDAGWNLGGMTQLNLVTDGRSGYEPAYANSLIIGKALTERLRLRTH